MKLLQLILLISSISFSIFGKDAEKEQASTNIKEINDSELEPVADDEIITLIPCGKFKSVRDDSDVT